MFACKLQKSSFAVTWLVVSPLPIRRDNRLVILRILGRLKRLGAELVHAIKDRKDTVVAIIAVAGRT